MTDVSLPLIPAITQPFYMDSLVKFVKVVPIYEDMTLDISIARQSEKKFREIYHGKRRDDKIKTIYLSETIPSKERSNEPDYDFVPIPESAPDSSMVAYPDKQIGMRICKLIGKSRTHYMTSIYREDTNKRWIVTSYKETVAAEKIDAKMLFNLTNIGKLPHSVEVTYKNCLDKYKLGSP